VDEGRLAAVVEPIGIEIFAVAVRPEIDGARGDGADEEWSEAAKEGEWSFVAVDVSVK
jgi:hypothetical protein